MQQRSSFAFPLIIALTLIPAIAHAQSPSATSKPEFGIGYKAGNGVGFAGLDLIVSPFKHLSFELQGSSFFGGFDSGFAIAPGVVGAWHDQGSTPYVKLGAIYIHATLDDAVVDGTGGFANIGYEWKWDYGLGIQLGGGVGYLQELKAVSGNESVTIGGKVSPNLEIGVRYRF